ncbi:MAG: hypothetical protein ACYTFH_01625 [Planctomycetota bacterium]
MRAALRRLAAIGMATATGLGVGGCAAFGAVGAISAQIDREKQIEVLAEYDGLRNRTVAVVVQSAPAMSYEYPTVVPNITANISRRLAENVEGAQLLDPRLVLQWQYQTPHWSALPYGRIADELGVERVVLIDIYEYRLHPPGNTWIWDGVCAATVGVIESGLFDMDEFADSFSVTVRFPDMEGVSRESATDAQIETGLLVKFYQRTAWLFFDHIEDKYPDD